MFDYESEYFAERRVSGIRSAVRYILGIDDVNMFINSGNYFSNKLKGDKNSIFWKVDSGRSIIDFNQHFIELSNNCKFPRSLVFLILIMEMVLIYCVGFFVFLLLDDFSIKWMTLFPVGMILFLSFVIYVVWMTFVDSSLFTALRARYRFNRTTRKVYVLRPKKFGGNAILDWDRVRVNMNWAQSGKWTKNEILNNPQARAERAERGRKEQNLLFYWPPLDENDPERKGEDVLWVGSPGAGAWLWDYLCVYMEKGMDAVPFPGPDAWLRKGFSGASEHLEENVMHRSHQMDDAAGQGTSTGTYINYALNMPWSPLNSLAERLCYWPTFPEEWNSDCGQKRRESGIGPEEPLRWEAKL